MTLLITYATFTIGVSFLCSLLEASLLSLPDSHVELMLQNGSRTGRILAQMKESIDRPLAGILTLNTIANTAGATGVGIQAGVIFGSQSLGVVSAVMTFLVLIFSEIIPKTLGAAHSRSLAGFTAVSVKAIILLTSPVLVIVTGLNRILKPAGEGKAVSRGELRANLRFGRRKGALDEKEFRRLDNFFALRHIRIKDVMTPQTVVFSLPHDMTVQEADSKQKSFNFTRIPILSDDDLDKTTSYTTRTDILLTNRNGKPNLSLADIAKPFLIVPELASVADALDICIESHEHILLVVDEYGSTAGIISLEDIMETLLGIEIVDETDREVDMRELARRHFQERHAEAIVKWDAASNLASPEVSKKQ
ncbi:MAG: CNNM domain-containing protein [Planctomycetota bacterium]|jgi:CBS domain containing-hemolysin-like protein